MSWTNLTPGAVGVKTVVELAVLPVTALPVTALTNVQRMPSALTRMLKSRVL